MDQGKPLKSAPRTPPCSVGGSPELHDEQTNSCTTSVHPSAQRSFFESVQEKSPVLVQSKLQVPDPVAPSGQKDSVATLPTIWGRDNSCSDIPTRHVVIRAHTTVCGGRGGSGRDLSRQRERPLRAAERVPYICRFFAYKALEIVLLTKQAA
jgi:hypothetical protein